MATFGDPFGQNTSLSGGLNNSSNSSKYYPDYRWWRGTDGNIWANVEGIGVINAGADGGMLRALEGGFVDNGKEIADPVNGTQSTESNTSNISTASTTNSAYSAQAAKEAARTAEAQAIKDRMSGRRGELDNILNAVLSAIDSTYKEESTKRKGQYDSDAADLLKTLNAALPEIASSFAAIGSYDSSWNNDSQAKTTDKYNDSQASLTSEYNTDMATLGSKANQARTDARTSYNNNQIDFDTLANTNATSDSLESLRSSENSLNKAINEFSQSQNYYKPGSQFAKELSNLGGAYDYDSIKDAFKSYLSTAGAGATDVTKNLQSEAKDKVTKSNKTELQENTPTSIK